MPGWIFVFPSSQTQTSCGLKRNAYKLVACDDSCTDFFFPSAAYLSCLEVSWEIFLTLFYNLQELKKTRYYCCRKEPTLTQLFSHDHAFWFWYGTIIAQIYWQLWLLEEALLTLKLPAKFSSFHGTRNSISHSANSVRYYQSAAGNDSEVFCRDILGRYFLKYCVPELYELVKYIFWNYYRIFIEALILLRSTLHWLLRKVIKLLKTFTKDILENTK